MNFNFFKIYTKKRLNLEKAFSSEDCFLEGCELLQ